MSISENDLFKTIEELRLKKYSHIPAEIIREILKIEENTVQNRSEGMKKIKIEVEKYLTHE